MFVSPRLSNLILDYEWAQFREETQRDIQFKYNKENVANRKKRRAKKKLSKQSQRKNR